jgi:tetratricopeptide (TPR) repeat protein
VRNPSPAFLTHNVRGCYFGKFEAERRNLDEERQRLRCLGSCRASHALALTILFGFPRLPGLVDAAASDPLVSNPVAVADDFYLGRRRLDNVRKGIAVLRMRVADNPRDYEAWWRLSEFTSYLARHSSGTEEVRLLGASIDAGKKAVALRPNRVEGHFWLGANYGLLAEAKGPLKGLFLVDTIRHEMETVIRLDPNFDEGAGERVLGRLYYRAPFFKGGDKRRSVALLEKCLKRFPENSLTVLYLADSYWAVGRRKDARALLESMLKMCPHALYGPEQEDNQAEARERLRKEFR